MNIVILVAIPFFLSLILLEILVDIRRQTGYYRLNDAINSLQLGILSRFSNVLLALIPFSFYLYFYNNWRLFELSQEHYWVWLLAIVGYDIAYYWIHRFSHTINIMWASHVVHHSSEEYNLTTALRQTSTPAVFAWIILAPLALFGIPPEVIVVSASLNLVYQYWVHTRHIDKMPAWYEAIFVTPSHHRVHHALNRDYIDKNFAGIFIIWDKLFGSFQEEKQDTPVVFGISSQLASWNPIKANLQVYLSLWQDFVVTKGIKNKIKVWLSPPSWRSIEAKQLVPRKYVTTKNLIKYDCQLELGQKWYLLFQHLAVLVLTLSWLLSIKTFATSTLVFTCCFGLFTLYVISTLQENKRYCIPLELIRLASTACLIYVYSPITLITLLTIAYAVASLFWLIKAFKNKEKRDEQIQTDVSA